MKIDPIRVERWGLTWHSCNKLDGERKHVMWDWKNGTPALFHTKTKAAKWAKEHYGYIATRKDLRNEPHGWKMPKPIRVQMVVSFIRTKEKK